MLGDVNCLVSSGGNLHHRLSSTLSCGCNQGPRCASKKYLSLLRQWVTVVTTGMRKLWILRRSFNKLTIQNFSVLFSMMIQTAIMHGAQSWSQCLKKDGYWLERVQRRLTKFVWRIQQLSYEWRLETLNLYSLSYRRDRLYLMAVYYTLKGYDWVELCIWFKIDMTGRQGHPLRRYKLRSSNLRVDLSLSDRMANQWNRFPSNMVIEPFLRCLKGILSAIMW